MTPTVAAEQAPSSSTSIEATASFAAQLDSINYTARTATISGTGTPRETVSLVRSLSSYTEQKLGSTVVGTDGTWTIETASVPPGSYVFEARETSGQRATVSVDVRKDLPLTAEVIEDHGSGVTLGGTARAHTSVLVTLGLEFAIARVDADGNWTARIESSAFAGRVSSLDTTVSDRETVNFIVR